MKPRARIVGAFVVAILSSAAIVAIATNGVKPSRTEIKKLKRFQTDFNNRMKEVMKFTDKTAAESTVAAEKCADFEIRVRAYRIDDPKRPGAKLCDLTIAQKEELRAEVNRWLDSVYAGKVPRSDYEFLLAPTVSNFYLMSAVRRVVSPPPTDAGQ
jgi:hypothetical protein